MNGREELGRLFELEVELLSEQGDIDFKKLIGQPLTVRLQLADRRLRYFAGLVSRLGHIGTQGRYQRYQATLRPWLWELTRKSDCWIFQKKTAVEIIKAVLREHGITFSESLSRAYRSRDYCVQYRETDFDFISRLLEEEGSYFKPADTAAWQGATYSAISGETSPVAPAWLKAVLNNDLSRRQPRSCGQGESVASCHSCAAVLPLTMCPERVCSK